MSQWIMEKGRMGNPSLWTCGQNDWQADTCENITFLKLCLQSVMPVWHLEGNSSLGTISKTNASATPSGRSYTWLDLQCRKIHDPVSWIWSPLNHSLENVALSHSFGSSTKTWWVAKHERHLLYLECAAEWRHHSTEATLISVCSSD